MRSGNITVSVLNDFGKGLEISRDGELGVKPLQLHIDWGILPLDDRQWHRCKSSGSQFDFFGAWKVLVVLLWHRFLASVDRSCLVEVGVGDPHDDAFVNELKEILVVVDQLRQLVMLLWGDFSCCQLLSGGLGLGLAWSARVGVASLILHVLLLAFNEDLAVLDDGVAQEFHNDDEDLQAALSEVDSLVKFSLGIDLLFELLVSLGEVTLGLLCIRLHDVGLSIFPLDRQLILRFHCLVIFILYIDITDGLKECLHDFLVVEHRHQINHCLVLLVLNHKSCAVDRKDTSLDVARSSIAGLVNEEAMDELD